MKGKEVATAEKPLTPTKLKGSFSWRGGIEIETEGFTYEQSKALLQQFINARRIAAYWLIIVAVIALTAFLGGNLSEIIKILSQPP